LTGSWMTKNQIKEKGNTKTLANYLDSSAAMAVSSILLE
jgi:hypothetical protein